MRPPMFTAGLTALALAAVASMALADSAVPGGPAPGRGGPAGDGVAAGPSAAEPSYPGPGVETWANRRFPPPAPPGGPGLATPGAGTGRAQMSAAAILAAVGGSGVEDQFEDCMGKTDGMDFADALGTCFCLTVDTDLAPGCTD